MNTATYSSYNQLWGFSFDVLEEEQIRRRQLGRQTGNQWKRKRSNALFNFTSTFFANRHSFSVNLRVDLGVFLACLWQKGSPYLNQLLH